jgi:hypothetical protein
MNATRPATTSHAGRVLRSPSHEDLGPLLGHGAGRLTHVLSDELQSSAGVERHRVTGDRAGVGDLGNPAVLGVQPVGGGAGGDHLDLLRAHRKTLAAALDHVRDADEIGDELVDRVLVEVFRGRHLLDPAVVEDGDPVRHRQRLVLVVGDVDEGDADVALDRLQLNLHLLAQLQVEGAERLVQQQHPRPVDDRPRQRHPLALAAGELSRLAVAVAGQADHLQRRVAAPRPLGLVDLRHFQPVGDVVADAHVGEERVVLEDGVDCAFVGRQAGDVDACQFDPAGGRVLEPRDHPQRRRLA